MDDRRRQYGVFLTFSVFVQIDAISRNIAGTPALEQK
jgi:hypothetical protein